MNSDKFLKADLSAPRYRTVKRGLAGKPLYASFYKKHPDLKGVISNIQYREIVKEFNKEIMEAVCENRDGVELPESLGFLFIGAIKYTRSQKAIDYTKSRELNKTVYHKNWDTDMKIGKLIFTMLPAKYKMKDGNMWAFKASRKFSRMVSKNFKFNYERYMDITHQRISHLFKETHVR